MAQLLQESAHSLFFISVTNVIIDFLAFLSRFVGGIFFVVSELNGIPEPVHILFIVISADSNGSPAGGSSPVH